jgi:hypothetical protein
MIDRLEQLSREDVDLIYSVPYVSGPNAGTVLDNTFFMYCHSHIFPFIKTREEVEKTLNCWNKIFEGFLRCHEDVVDWIRMTWPWWERYCTERALDPGICPLDGAGGQVTDIGDLVF